MKTRRVVVLAALGVAVLGGVLLVGLLPTRVDGGVEGQVRAFVDQLRAAGLTWVDYDLIDFLANVGFFVPVGFLAGMLLPQRIWWLAIPAGGLLSAAIEFGQYVFLPDRYASWTDVLANTIGALLGALLARALRAAWRPRAPRAERR